MGARETNYTSRTISPKFMKVEASFGQKMLTLDSWQGELLSGRELLGTLCGFMRGKISLFANWAARCIKKYRVPCGSWQGPLNLRYQLQK